MGETPPRLAASVLLLRDAPLRVLMVRRGAGLHYSSALVFPGGVVDPEDHAPGWRAHLEDAPALDEREMAVRIAACREMWEEIGVTLAKGPCAIAAVGSPSFLDAIDAASAKLVLGDLVPFGHWITPAWAPRRFDTHFFLAALAEDAEPCCDGDENVAIEWIEPSAAITRWAAGDSGILFPTRMNLQRLAESRDVAGAIAAARRRPPVTVTPEIEERDGVTIVRVSAAAGYGDAEEVLPARRAN